jgi:hypothetical protein
MEIEAEENHPLGRDISSHIVWDAQSNAGNEPAQIEDIIMATLLVGHPPSNLQTPWCIGIDSFQHRQSTLSFEMRN